MTYRSGFFFSFFGFKQLGVFEPAYVHLTILLSDLVKSRSFTPELGDSQEIYLLRHNPMREIYVSNVV